MKQQLNYRVSGEGKEVIVIHGLFGSMDNLTPVVRSLADSYKVLSVDLRNHGRSFHRPTMTYPEMAGDVLALMDDLGMESAVVIGHSMGGKVAMQMAVEAPKRVDALVVGDIAPVDYPPHHQSVLKALQAYNPEQAQSRSEADKQLSEFIDMPAVRRLLIKNLKKSENGQFVWRMNVQGIFASYTSICAAPEFGGRHYSGATLFIKGENSDYLLPEHREVVARLFPRVELRIITGAGHWLHTEKPALFNAVLMRFMNSL